MKMKVVGLNNNNNNNNNNFDSSMVWALPQTKRRRKREFDAYFCRGTEISSQYLHLSSSLILCK